MRVTVVYGNYVICTSHCKGFVLGNDWMKTHNPTKFDHEKNCVTIGIKGNKLVQHGIPEEGKLNMISSKTMSKVLNESTLSSSVQT